LLGDPSAMEIPAGIISGSTFNVQGSTSPPHLELLNL
jgi:hypothetical protein